MNGPAKELLECLFCTCSTCDLRKKMQRRHCYSSGLYGCVGCRACAEHGVMTITISCGFVGVLISTEEGS
jgi:hypothetical protein